MDQATVTVLMSTYYGAKNDWLQKQIDSILGQKNVNVNLVIRDDGSVDDTLKIIREYSELHSNVVVLESKQNLGACGSFLALISDGSFSSEFYALADQDDVWDLDKLYKGIQLLKTLPQDKPALYFSNLRIVDANNNYIRLAHSYPQVPVNKYSYLSDPLPAGCTCIYNKHLAKIANDVQPTTYSMHDTWVYNVAELFGNVVYDFEPHINYRQHGNNVDGAPKHYFSFEGVRRQLDFILDRRSQPRYKNVLILLSQFETSLSPDQLKMLKMIANYKAGIINQLKLLRCKEIEPGNRYRNLKWKLKILLKNI